MEQFAPYVKKRHDFVHRGGKDSDGNDVTTSKAEVEALIDLVEVFGCSLETKNVFNELLRT